jgi:hypothetical protein
MTNKLYLMKRNGRLTCKWVRTGDPRLPLVCVWIESKTTQTVSTPHATDGSGRMHQCA